jgi:hypothetical protein
MQGGAIGDPAESGTLKCRRRHQIEERLKQRLRRYLQATLGDAVPMTTTANA